jgi:hypothetical protein
MPVIGCLIVLVIVTIFAKETVGRNNRQVKKKIEKYFCLTTFALDYPYPVLLIQL